MTINEDSDERASSGSKLVNDMDTVCNSVRRVSVIRLNDRRLYE